jgi:hypothetical protein
MSKETANMDIEHIEMEDLDLSDMGRLAVVMEYILNTMANEFDSENNAIKKLPVADTAGQDIGDVLNTYNNTVKVINDDVTEFVEEIDYQLKPMLEAIYRQSQKLQELYGDIKKRREGGE